MKLFAIPLALLALCACLLSSCKSRPGGSNDKQTITAMNAVDAAAPKGIKIESQAFKDGATIPTQYTCKGTGVSPPLDWSGISENAKSLALVVEDPDAPGGTFTHWIMFNIPPLQTVLQQNVPKTETLPNGSVQGTNDFQKIGWGPPCPPSGTHRYIFKLYALDGSLNLKPGATKKEFVAALANHIVSSGQFIGLVTK